MDCIYVYTLNMYVHYICTLSMDVAMYITYIYTLNEYMYKELDTCTICTYTFYVQRLINIAKAMHMYNALVVIYISLFSITS